MRGNLAVQCDGDRACIVSLHSDVPGEYDGRADIVGRRDGGARDCGQRRRRCVRDGPLRCGSFDDTSFNAWTVTLVCDKTKAPPTRVAGFAQGKKKANARDANRGDAESFCAARPVAGRSNAAGWIAFLAERMQARLVSSSSLEEASQDLGVEWRAMSVVEKEPYEEKGRENNAAKDADRASYEACRALWLEKQTALTECRRLMARPHQPALLQSPTAVALASASTPVAAGASLPQHAAKARSAYAESDSPTRARFRTRANQERDALRPLQDAATLWSPAVARSGLVSGATFREGLEKASQFADFPGELPSGPSPERPARTGRRGIDLDGACEGILGKKQRKL